MTADLDTLARSAAADLHRRAERVDTEAALHALHRSAGTGPHRVRRMVPSGRVLALAAAAVVVLAGLAFAVGTQGGDATEHLGTETTLPIDPTSFGPLLGTLHGVDDAGLTAEVYGPKALDDGSEVAVSITGGIPGQAYLVSQCAVGDPDYSPVVSCATSDGPTLDGDGAGVAVIEAWTVFDGTGAAYRNDCRKVACELQIGAIVEDDQPDEGRPGTQFADQAEHADALTDSPWIPITFAADAGAPPLPELTASFLGRTDQGTRVRLKGSNLQPGPTLVLVDGFDEPRTGMLAHVPGVGPAEIDQVEVAADGTFSAEVVLPDAVTQVSTTTINDIVQDPEIVACDASPSYCVVQVASRNRSTGSVSGSGAARRPLTAPPVRYPES